MRASVVTRLGAPLELRQIPVPSPDAGQVLVRVEASGLCHTDVHAARGDWPIRASLPVIPGHEGVGRITRVGSGVAGLAVGDRVAIPWLGDACGACRYCESGRDRLCEAQRNTGYTLDGTHAQYAVAYARHVVRVPDTLNPIEAAPLTCAGATAYRAVTAARVAPGERVAVFGVGGLGHLAIQYAHILGGETVAVDVTSAKLALARQLGATHTVDATHGDAAGRVRGLGGADVALVLSPAPTVAEQAYASLRRGGRLVLVSLPKQLTIPLPVLATVLGELSVTGSVVGSRDDLVDVLALHAAGRTTVVTETRGLDEINDAIDDLQAGRVTARVVFEP